MGISDEIAWFIEQVLQTADGVAELRRAHLAERFGCVPSQINYVLATRFTPQHGYLVEGRRGGGGYIRITQARPDAHMMLRHTMAAAGGSLDRASLLALLSNLASADVIPAAQLRLVAAAADDTALRAVPPHMRDTVRADLVTQCLLVFLTSEQHNKEGETE